MRVRTLFEFVKFEHTLFSLPVMLAGAFLAAGGVPPVAPLLWIVLAGTGARTLAMALNRILDRDIDARNPRTAQREIPAGAMSTGQATLVAVAGLVLFAFATWRLPPLCLKLLPIPVVVFAAYPLLKRFTPLAHFGVGLALGLAPLAAAVAVTGALPKTPAILLGVFTLLWVAGFDVIYATLDEAFDRREGLHSLPAAVGRENALRIAALVHSLAFAVLVWLTRGYLSGVAAWICLALVGALLVWEHGKAKDVDLAFFRINAALGFVVLALVWSGLAL